MHAMSGCMNSVGMFNRQFESASQSINYIQCHGNECFYDKLKIARPLSNDDDFRNRFKIAAIAILFANGIPFFSEGQEIMQTKHGNSNSYNAGDYINGLDYDQAFKEKGMLKFLKNAIALKKEFIKAAGNNYAYIMNNINSEVLQNNSVVCRYNFKRYNYAIIFNPMKSSIKYTFKHPATKVLRVSFLKAEVIKNHAEIDGKKEWKLSDINSKFRKDLIQYLNSYDSRSENVTVWAAMRFEWNSNIKSIKGVNRLSEYIVGKYDTPENLRNPDYIPYNMQMPDYTTLH